MASSGNDALPTNAQPDSVEPTGSVASSLEKAPQPVKLVGRQIGQERLRQAQEARQAQEQAQIKSQAMKNAETRRQEAINPSRPILINRFGTTRKNTGFRPPAPPASVVSNNGANNSNGNSIANLSAAVPNNVAGPADAVAGPEAVAVAGPEAVPGQSEEAEQNASNKNSVIALPEGADDLDADADTEEQGPILETARGDASLPHILKIGESSYAEYITLKQIPIGTRGNFNALQTGSKEVELQRKYGIESDEQISAMQRAFGVRNQHQTPPIFAMIEKGCVPKGFDLVRNALETRLDTLDTNIDAIRSSMASNPMRQRQRWIHDLLEKTSNITNECGDETVTNGNEKKLSGTSGCPCLDELSLLRNLTYIIGLLVGTTDPTVKQQLEKITLEKMLNTAQASNSKQVTRVLEDIISVLKEYIKNPKIVQETISNDDERIQAILKPIYTTVIKMQKRPNTTNMVTPPIVTLDMIMKELDAIIQLLEKGQKQEMEYKNLQDRILGLEKELVDAKSKGANADADASTKVEQIKALQEGIEAFAKSLQAKENELAEAKADASGAREELKTATDRLVEEAVRLARLLGEEERKVQTKDAEIHRLEGSIAEKDAESRALQDSMASLQREHEEYHDVQFKRISSLEEEIRQKESKIQELSGLIRSATDEISRGSDVRQEVETRLQALQQTQEDVNRDLERLRAEKNALSDALQATKTSFTEIERKLVACQAALEGSKAQGERKDTRIAELEAELARLRQQLNTKGIEIEQLQAERAELRTRIASSDKEIEGLRGQIAELGAEKVAVSRELEAEKEKTKSLETIRATFEEQKAKLQTELGEKQTLIGRLEAELASATAEGQSSKSDKESLERELATEKAKVASLEARLAELISQSDASKIQVDEAHRAQIAALEAQLANTTAEVEGIKKVAKDEREGLIRAQEEQISGKEAEIEALREQLGSAIETAEQKGAIEANLTTKTAELEAAKGALADLRAELATRPTQSNLDQRNARLAEKDRIIAEKEANINELKQQLATLQSQMEAQKTEKEGLALSLAKAQETAQDMVGKEVLAEKETAIAKLQEELDHMSRVVDAQAGALEEAKGATGFTKERLNTLLGYLLIHPELREKAQAFLAGDDTAGAELQGDVCELYTYLVAVLNLQLRKIESSGLPVQAKRDIFTIFKSISEGNEMKLLSELSMVFQELFVNLSTSTIREGLVLKHNYPELTAIISAYNLDGGKPINYTGKELDKLLIELNSFGYLSSVYIEPNAGKLVLRKKGAGIPIEFASANMTHMTPLVILGIKMIQLLSKLFNSKYQDLARRCGLPESSLEGLPEFKFEGVELPAEEPVAESSEEKLIQETKARFDKAFEDLRDADIPNHMDTYIRTLNDKFLMDQKRLPGILVYSVLLNEYAKHKISELKGKPPVGALANVARKIPELEKGILAYEKKPVFAPLIRKTREHATK